MRPIWLAAVALIWTAPAEAHLSRPTFKDPEPLQFDPEDRVLVYRTPGGHFQIFYVIDGRNGVGSENLDRDIVVDRIERIAEAYDEGYLTFTSTLGFAPPPSDEQQFPDNGGDARIDVYVLDTGEVPGGRLIEGCPMETPDSCWSFIVHPIASTDDLHFARRALFSIILAGYRAYFDVALEIGSAAWAADDPSFDGMHPSEVSLGDRDGSYDGGTTSFFRFIAERHGKAIIRELWIAIAAARAPPDWRLALDDLLEQRGSSLARTFADYSVANAASARIDPWPKDQVPEFAPLSARYYLLPQNTEPHVAGADSLTLERMGDLVAAINGSLQPIRPQELCAAGPDERCQSGCTCARVPRARATWLLLLLALSRPWRRWRSKRGSHRRRTAASAASPAASRRPLDSRR